MVVRFNSVNCGATLYRTVSLLTTALLSDSVWTAVVSATWWACHSPVGTRCYECPLAASFVSSAAVLAYDPSTAAQQYTNGHTHIHTDYRVLFSINHLQQLIHHHSTVT